MLYGGHFGPKNLMLKLHTFSCVFVILLLSVFLVLKSLVFLLLSLSFLFEFRLPPLLTRHNTPFSPSSCRFSMPLCGTTPRLERTKARLIKEQQTRTDRRVQALLRPRLTRQDTELSDDSEEETTLTAIRTQTKREQATQTDRSSLSFGCGVFVGVCLVVCLLVFLILYKTNERQKSA